MGYDQQGRPLLDKPFKKYYTEFLKAPFKPIRNEDGRDYFSDFVTIYDQPIKMI